MYRLQVVEEKPVLICEVEYLKDDEDDGDSAEVGGPTCRAPALLLLTDLWVSL